MKRPKTWVWNNNARNRTETPSRARLIHLLIEERAKVLALERAHRTAACLIHDSDRDQARREIESEALSVTKDKP